MANKTGGAVALVAESIAAFIATVAEYVTGMMAGGAHFIPVERDGKTVTDKVTGKTALADKAARTNSGRILWLGKVGVVVFALPVEHDAAADDWTEAGATFSNGNPGIVVNVFEDGTVDGDGDGGRPAMSFNIGGPKVAAGRKVSEAVVERRVAAAAREAAIANMEALIAAGVIPADKVEAARAAAAGPAVVKLPAR